MKYSVAIFLLLFFIASCHKNCHHAGSLCDEPNLGIGECITDSNQLKPLIIGKWNWTQTMAGWTMEKTNPCTESRQRSYVFEADGTARYFENDTLKGTGYYYFWNNSGSKITVRDSAYTFGTSGWIKVCGSYLVIDEMPVDGNKETFVRAQ